MTLSLIKPNSVIGTKDIRKIRLVLQNFTCASLKLDFDKIVRFRLSQKGIIQGKVSGRIVGASSSYEYFITDK